MKKVILKIPINRIEEFITFINGIDITISVSWSSEDFMDSVYIYCIIILEKSVIPLELKTEKLKEKFGKYIVERIKP